MYIYIQCILRAHQFGLIRMDLLLLNYITPTKSLIIKVKFFSSRFTLSSSRNKKHARNNFTCVTCHPKEDCIATGHKDGKIRLWSVYSWRAWWSFISSGLVLQNRGIPGYREKDRTEKQLLIVDEALLASSLSFFFSPFCILLYSSLHTYYFKISTLGPRS